MVELPIIDTMVQRPDYLPLAVPIDLVDRIMRLHGNPAAWWIGQFLKYMFKQQKKTADFLDGIKSKLDFKGPIVG